MFPAPATHSNGLASVNKRCSYPCSGQIRGKETSRVMDHEGAPSPLLFPAPPCHLRIINSRGAGGQIRAITHVGRADKTQTLSVTLHDICFSFHFRPREKSTCFISSMGSTQDPLLSVCHLLTLMAVRWLTVSCCTGEEWTSACVFSLFHSQLQYLERTNMQ